MIEREIVIKLAPREDGGLRVWSDDIPGLILSSPSQEAALSNIGPAIIAVLSARASKETGNG